MPEIPVISASVHMMRILNLAKAATCSHLKSHLSSLEQPLVATCPGANVCKWLQVAAQVAASGCWEQVAAFLKKKASVLNGISYCSRASGCKWLLKWLQVAASGCKWLLGASGSEWLQVAAQVAASGSSGCKWEPKKHLLRAQ